MNVLSMVRTPTRLRYLAVAVALGAASPVAAQINFAGNTSFAFNNGSLGSPASLSGLTVTNTGFNVTTVPLGGNLSFASIGGIGNNFGAISLTGAPTFYNNVPFQLLIAFTSPQTTSQTFFASIFGVVASAANGGVNFMFNPTTINNIPFASGNQTGTYSLTVNSVSVTPGQTNAQFTGSIVATTNPPVTSTPEPATLAMLAPGVVGALGFMRRRRS